MSARDEVESSYITITIECSSCHVTADIEDVEILTRYPGQTPHGHHFDLPDGWTLNPPGDGALAGIGVTCDECSTGAA